MPTKIGAACISSDDAEGEKFYKQKLNTNRKIKGKNKKTWGKIMKNVQDYQNFPLKGLLDSWKQVSPTFSLQNLH
jgi:hypothetical protein